MRENEEDRHETQNIINALRTTESRSKRTLLDAAASALEEQRDRCARYAEEIAVLQEREKWVPVTGGPEVE